MEKYKKICEDYDKMPKTTIRVNGLKRVLEAHRIYSQHLLNLKWDKLHSKMQLEDVN